MKMDQEQIKTIIPHRDPMLLVTTVEELVPGESITTTFYVDPTREIFRGHFPGEVAPENLAGWIHVERGGDGLPGHQLFHSGHQQHGVPVGDDGFNLFLIHFHIRCILSASPWQRRTPRRRTAPPRKEGR